MPIYEYQCAACGHAFEAIQKMSDAPLQECPACAGLQLQKLVSAAGFRLKGGGWYETDFKGGAKKGEKKEETKEATAASAAVAPSVKTSTSA